MSEKKGRRFEMLEEPYEFECPSCGRTIKRYTDLPSKLCDCGAPVFFKSATDKEPSK